MSLPINPTGTNPVVPSQPPTARSRAQDSDGPVPVQPRGQEEAPNATEIARALGERTQRIVDGDRTVEFSFDDNVDRVVVTVKSGDDEIVRQIPPKDYVNFLAKFREMLGVLFDEKA